MRNLVLTIGDVARRFGCEPWRVRRLYESKRLPEPARVGAYRVVTESDLPEIEAALIEAGYIQPGEAAHA